MTIKNTLFTHTAIAVLLSAAALSAHAEDAMAGMNHQDMGNMTHMNDTMNNQQMSHEQMSAETYPLHGKVEKIDAANLTITLAHDAVTELNWPAMTMTFPVAKVQLLNGLSVGQTIDARFTAKEGGSPLIVVIKPAK